MRNGGDWSGSFPGVANMKSVGWSFAGRYLAYDHPRGITAWEEAALEAGGFDILGYYEEAANWMFGGYDAGVAAAQAVRGVLNDIGHYPWVPVNLACDLDIEPGQIGPVYNCLDGFASVAGRNNTGIYGGVVPVHLARASGHATYGVQAGAWRYRANEIGVSDPEGWSPYAHVRQDGYNLYVGGTQCDHLTAIPADFGQFRRAANPVPDPGSITIGPAWDPNQFANEPMIKPGDTAPGTSIVQFILNVALNAKLTVTGVLDSATEAPLKFWQSLAHLNPDGIVGPETWKSFGQYDARYHRFDQEPVLKFNDVGHPQAVKDLQMALNGVTVHGHTPLAVDGAFGPKVRDAVFQYQRNRRLTVNGEMDPSDWQDLGALLTQYGK